MSPYHSQRQFTPYFLLAALTLCSAFAHSQTPSQPAQSRGELLYSTHCVACHTTQMHWRADSQVSDWDTLKFQVRRWQGNASLQWEEADITEVTRYLNQTIYRYPPLVGGVGMLGPSSNSSRPQR